MTMHARWIAAAAVTVACGTGLRHPTYTPHLTSELVEVPFPPPPARVEMVPDEPRGAVYWVDGEWTWRGRKWGWRTGYFSAKPAGATYSPWQVTRNEAGTLFFAPGTWRDSSGQPMDPPPPLRVAGAGAQNVVDAEGETEPTGANLNPDGGRARSAEDAGS